MSKFSVTIFGDTVAEIVARAAELASGQLPTGGNMTMTHPAAASSDDDETGGATNAGELDSAGIPWDARIHSGGKNQKNQDGTWRRKRNLQDAEYNAVMTELQARRAVPGHVPPPPAPANVQGGVNAAMAAPPYTPPPNVTIPPQMAAPGAVPPPPVMAPPAPVAAPQQPAGMAFNQFMPLYSQAMNSGRFNKEQSDGFLQQWGWSDLGQLATDPVRTEQFYHWLKNAGLVD